MTFLEKVKECMDLGWIVEFSPQIMNVSITVKKEHFGTIYEKSSWLPTSDHFDEQTIIEAIDFNIERIQKLISKKE